MRSVFGAPDGGADAAGAPAAAPAVTLPPPQAAKTGEEDEECVFAAEGMLYEFDASKTWRERGRGEMRVNVPKGGGGHARLVMRSKGNLRLLMNANLWPDMIVTKMEGGKVGSDWSYMGTCCHGVVAMIVLPYAHHSHRLPRLHASMQQRHQAKERMATRMLPSHSRHGQCV